MSHSTVINDGVVAIFSIRPTIFWPYFLGIAVLAISLIAAIRERRGEARGMGRIMLFGPMFYAVPMGVFSGDHLMFPKEIAQIVPAWMPWHLFWVYFVGISLLVGAVGLTMKRYSKLAALCFGIMLFCFVAMIHIPALIAAPGDRFALAVMLRDLSFSCGALAFAVGETERLQTYRERWLLSVLRSGMALAAIIFGIEHFLHPDFVPVIPLRRPLPLWIPAHMALSYATGAVLIAAGVALLINRKARQAAIWLGTFVLAIVLLIYVPILLSDPSSNDGLNYVADTLLYSGSALLLARGLPKEQGQDSSTAKEATTIAA